MQTRVIMGLVPLLATAQAGAQVLFFEDFEGLTDNFIDADSFGSVPGADGPLASGTALFALNETLTLSTGTLSTADALPELFIDFTWATAGSSFDGAEFDISVNGTSVFNVFGPSLGSSTAPFFEQFASPPAIDISAFAGQDITVDFTLVSTSFSGFILLDNVSVFAVPSPSSAGLLALGGLVLGRRRRV